MRFRSRGSRRARAPDGIDPQQLDMMRKMTVNNLFSWRIAQLTHNNILETKEREGIEVREDVLLWDTL